MEPSRRDFLVLAAGGLAASCAPSFAGERAKPRYRAVAFDGFPVFDPRPVFALAEEIFPGQGAALGAAWRSRQFEYQWLRALAGRYADFAKATEDALVAAARALRLDLAPDARARLTAAFGRLKAWPDAAPALRTLRDAGVRLAFLSNMTPGMLEAGIANAGLDGLFDHVLSTDAVRTYKPDPRAYRLGLDAFGLEREEILFAAFAGWDAAGAKWFGYPTFWVNRLGSPREELGAAPDGEGRDLTDLVRFVLP